MLRWAWWTSRHPICPEGLNQSWFGDGNSLQESLALAAQAICGVASVEASTHQRRHQHTQDCYQGQKQEPVLQRNTCGWSMGWFDKHRRTPRAVSSMHPASDGPDDAGSAAASPGALAGIILGRLDGNKGGASAAIGAWRATGSSHGPSIAVASLALVSQGSESLHETAVQPLT